MNGDEHFEQIVGQVPAKSALQTLATSKVNLTQYAKLIAQVGVIAGYNASPEDVFAVLAAVEIIATAATVVFRTFFSSAGVSL